MKVFMLFFLLLISCNEDKKTELTSDLLSYVKDLSEFNRSALGSGIEASREYIKTKVESFGYQVNLEAFPFSYAGKNYVGKNIVFEKIGTNPKLKKIIMGAHYDSIRSSVIDTVPTPGANDNGSGVAIIMDIARQIKDENPERSIRFILFDGEEEGLYGSKYYADSLKAANDSIEFMFNIDMVAGRPTMTHSTIVCEEDRNNKNGNDAASKALNQELVEEMQAKTSLKVVKDLAFATDYVDFERNGYVIVGLYEYEGQSSPYYHKSSDTYSNINPSYFSEVAKGASSFIRKKIGL